MAKRKNIEPVGRTGPATRPGQVKTPGPVADPIAVTGVKLTPEQIAERKAKRMESKQTQMPYQTLLTDVTIRAGQPQAVVAAVVSAVKASIGKALLSGNVVMMGPDLGSFKVITTEPRKGRNPRTGETIDIPSGKRVRFQVGSALKTLLLTGQVAVRPSRPVQPVAQVVPLSEEPDLEGLPSTGAAPALDLIGGSSERARKIAARKSMKFRDGGVEAVVPGLRPAARLEPSSNAVSDSAIDDILNESMGEGEDDFL